MIASNAEVQFSLLKRSPSRFCTSVKGMMLLLNGGDFGEIDQRRGFYADERARLNQL
jgi:hypothetical protein